MKKIILLTLLIPSILTPYIGTIFFLRTTSLLILLSIDLLALVTLIITVIWYIRTEDSKTIKRLIVFAAIVSILCYFLFYGLLLNASDYVFFKLREERLNEFVIQIRNYGKIYEMSDGQGYWKTINNHSVEPNLDDVDTTSEFSKKYFLGNILEKEGIDFNTYENFRQQLIDTDFISFTTLDNGTVTFTIDGFLDNCQGFAYSETGDNPGYNDCGRITHWKKVVDNWYVWYTT